MAVDNNVIASATTAGIRSIHDFQFKPSVMEGIYRTYGNGFTMIDFLRKAAGRTLMVPNESITAEEQAYTHRTIKIGTVTPISNDSVSFTLDADDLDTLGNYYPRVGFSVLLGDTITGFTEARIVTISSASPPLLTLTRYNTSSPTMTAQISAGNIATGVEVSIGASAYAVETGQPAATSVGSFEREFYAQIMKETIKFGGMELAKQKWVQVEGIGLYNLELTRAEFLLDLQEAMALWMGQHNNNSITQVSSIDGKSNTVHKIKGVWNWIDELGGEIGIGSTGMDTDDLDTAAAYFESVGITNDIVVVIGGGEFMRKAENNFIDKVQGTSGGLTDSFTYVDGAIFNGAANMTLNFGFKCVKKGGILFCFVKDPIFANPNLLGNPTYKLDESAVMIPMTTVKDFKSGMTVPNLYAGYVGLGGYSRKRIVGQIGGMDGFMKQSFSMPIISEIDGNSTYWLSHTMFPFLEAYKGLIIKRTS